jgi:ADP-ribose pyrophosphatase YjhB (NUDIX family)
MILSNNEPCSHCGRFANRGVTIDAIIIKDNKVLLIKRGVEPFKGYWALPGGYVGWEETIAEAVQREVNEELGVTASSVKEVGIYSDPARHPKQCIDVAHYVEIDGEPKAADDAQEFRYFPLSELPADMAFDHKKLIDDYLTKELS